MSENLETVDVYLYPKENAESHKTDKFEIVKNEENPIAVLRRGLKFTVCVRFASRVFDPNDDQLRLIFSYGAQPMAAKGTKAIVNVTSAPIDTSNDKFWFGSILGNGPDFTVSLEVYIPSTAPVGLWKLEVETDRINSFASPKQFIYKSDIYVLFNPWACHDMVCMPESRLLNEYILEEVGKIWVGPWGSSKGREWVFGQFSKNVLPAAWQMIEKSNLSPSSRGDPVKMTRMISKMANSNDDDGILVGRWDGDYSDGTAPSAWTGSVPILNEYVETKEPVSYGQCWVFAGVITTLCRALGIPSRVVSNLVSAHDANGSLTVDKYYNKDNEELEVDPNNPNGEDSIWNYHVWNEVWMARPDLPPGYGGWQAIDATPQETSSGFFQCGPASLEAIRQGEVGYNYDVPFMVASVNADIMRWKEDPNHTLGYARIYCNKYHVGRLILTKKPFVFDHNGDRDREDITTLYKPKEGTESERLSLYNAVRGSITAKKFFEMPEHGLEDMEFHLVDLDKINIGETFQVIVNIKNKSKEVRHISALITTLSMYYTGVKAHLIERAKGSFAMNPNSSEVMRMVVKPEKYMDKLVEYGLMKIYGIATVQETKQTWADEDDFQITRPQLKVEVPDKVIIKNSTKITLSFKNPMHKNLTNSTFRLDGPTLSKNYVVTHPDIQPGEEAKVEILIEPQIAGQQVLIATFNSPELHDITGSAKVDIIG